MPIRNKKVENGVAVFNLTRLLKNGTRELLRRHLDEMHPKMQTLVAD